MRVIGRLFGVVVVIAVFAFVLNTQMCFSAQECEGRVNINSATVEQLSLLPGVGAKIAEDIVAYRTSKGNFTSAEDLKKVKGIGDKKFDKVKDFVATDGETTIKVTKEKGKKEKE